MKRILTILAGLLLLICLPLAVFAEDTLVAEPTGSITVKVVYRETPLQGLKLSAYRVGNLMESAEGEQEFRRALDRKSLDAQIKADPKALAEEMYHFVEYNSHTTFGKQTEVADDKGNIVFEDFMPGLYLIVQEEDYSLNGQKYEKLNYFLVTIPYNGKYRVDATAKASLDVFEEPPETTEPTVPTETTEPTEPTETTEPTEPSETTEPTNPSETTEPTNPSETTAPTNPSETTAPTVPTVTTPKEDPGGKLPQTGQMNWPVPLLACIGMFLFGLGWCISRSEEKDDYEA